MQLYVLCDVAAATIHALGNQMGLGAATLSAKYPGSITLPKNLYRPLDKEERGGARLQPSMVCLWSARYAAFRALVLLLAECASNGCIPVLSDSAQSEACLLASRLLINDSKDRVLCRD